jgi:hypothetical protein
MRRRDICYCELRRILLCTVDFKRWSLAPLCLSNVSGTRTPSVPAAMARALGPVDVALGVKFRPGTQAKAAWGSSTSLTRRAGRSLSPIHSTVWIATLASSGLSRSSSKGRAASLDGNHLCRECDGTGGCSIARRPQMGSLRKPTVSVPAAMRHATVWDTRTVIFVPAPRPSAAS